MIEKKTTLVADLLYGSIVISPLEKRLISTMAFNRLHNVLQNSNVYFTFPSNRTSRFSHSLGVAKLAGEIFYNSLLNAPNLRHAFLGQLSEKLMILKKSLFHKSEEDGKSKVDRAIHSDTPDESLLCSAQLEHITLLDNPLYASFQIAGLSPSEQYNYIIVLQSLRFVALLHDLGHPPFSHVGENALSRIYFKLKHAVDPTPEQSKVIDEISSALKGGSGAFHEAVGFSVAKSILDGLVNDVALGLLTACKKSQITTLQKAHSIFATLLIKECSLAILKTEDEEEDIFKAVHEIVAGSFDADRLDYVQRDMLMSGMSRESYRLERLLQTYVLIQKPSVPNALTEGAPSDIPGNFYFAPSVRALSVIEEFFTKRFDLYKYVICHHRVVKFDALMEKCIEDLADRHFKSPQISRAGHYILDDGISGLWQVFSKEASSRVEKFYMQWDDAWLLNVLRRQSLLMLPDPNSQDQRESVTDPDDELLKIRLEELLSNRKYYQSLFKRSECFHFLDQAFALEACQSQASRIMTMLQKPPFRRSFFDDYIALRDSATENRAEKHAEIVAKSGYILPQVISAIRKRVGKAPMPFFQNTGDQLLESNKDFMRDVLVIPKIIKAGVTPDFIVADTENRPTELSQLSKIAEELEQASMYVPPFYIFILPVDDKVVTIRDISRWRQDFGRLLWLNIEKVLIA